VNVRAFLDGVEASDPCALSELLRAWSDYIGSPANQMLRERMPTDPLILRCRPKPAGTGDVEPES
jgi:hypothetical protein